MLRTAATVPVPGGLRPSTVLPLSPARPGRERAAGAGSGVRVPSRPARVIAREGAAAETSEALRAWVREARVTFEVSPLREQVDGRRLQVGVAVQLFARLPKQAHMDPGSALARRLQTRLRTVARAVAPEAHPAVRCRVDPARAAIYLRPEAHFAPEVQVTLRIEHRDGYLRPLTTEQRQCAEQAREGLTALGCRARSWRGTP